MIGTDLRRRPLVSLVTRPPRPGYVCRGTVIRPLLRSMSSTLSPAASLIRKCRCRQDHHAVTPDLMASALYRTMHQPSQCLDPRQCVVA